MKLMKKSELINIIKETLNEQKKKGLDGKACWKGYKLQGTKMKGGKRVDNCVKNELKVPHRKSGYMGYSEPVKNEEIELKNPKKADLNKDGELSSYEKTRGAAIEKNIEEDLTIKEVLDMEIIDDNITEAKYKGKTVTLNKPTRGDSKKFKVYVNTGKKNADGSIKVKKVNFGHGGTTAKKAGQKTMSIRKSNPKRRKAFRARHRCNTPGPKTMARYWSCKKW